MKNGGPTLVVMVGLPGAGKSSRARRMKRFTRVCHDDIRIGMYGEYRFIPADEPRVHKKAIGMIRSLLQRGCSVVVDSANVDKPARFPWIKMRAEGLAWKLEAVVVTAGSTECRDRIRFRGRAANGTLMAFDRMRERWDPPTKAEGFDSVRFVTNHRRRRFCEKA